MTVVTEIATGAGVHRGNEDEGGGEALLIGSARDGDLTGFQGLAQRFQRLAAEFRQFIEEEDAAMSEADLARRRGLAPSDQTDGRRRMVGSPERRPGVDAADR